MDWMNVCPCDRWSWRSRWPCGSKSVNTSRFWYERQPRRARCVCCSNTNTRWRRQDVTHHGVKCQQAKLSPRGKSSPSVIRDIQSKLFQQCGEEMGIKFNAACAFQILWGCCCVSARVCLTWLKERRVHQSVMVCTLQSQKPRGRRQTTSTAGRASRSEHPPAGCRNGWLEIPLSCF